MYAPVPQQADAEPVSDDAINRRRTMVLTWMSTIVCYADRVNMSVAVLPMGEQYAWNPADSSYVLASFWYGYVLTQYLGGKLSIRYGGERVLGVGVLCYSMCTLATPLAAATSFRTLLCCRFLMGMGEGVAFPAEFAIFGSLARGPAEKAQANTVNYACCSLGTVCALVFSPILSTSIHWTAIFYMFGSAGLCWCAVWGLHIAKKLAPVDMEDQDHAMPTVSKWAPTTAQLALGPSPTVRQMCGKGAVVGLCTAHFANNWGWYILLSFIPTYFHKQLGVSMAGLSYLTIWGYIIAMCGSITAGWYSGRLVRRGVDVTLVRKGFTLIGFCSPATILAVMCLSSSASFSIACIILALSSNSVGQAGWGCNHMDISHYPSTLMGLSNTIATVPAMLGIPLTGIIVHEYGSWSAVFIITSVVYIGGAIAFGILGSGKLTFPEETVQVHASGAAELMNFESDFFPGRDAHSHYSTLGTD